jgi:acetyl esterase/lipase
MVHIGRVLLAIVLLCTTACTDAGLTLINASARFGDYERVADIAYGDHARQQLDIYRPEIDSHTLRPTVLFFYGGCWGGCKTWPKEQYRFVAEALTAAGFVTVLADYRLHPDVRFPAIIADAASALSWVSENITAFGGDPHQLFVMGHSAGAHLSAMLAFDDTHVAPATYESIAGFIGLAGPYDFLPLTKSYQREVFGPEENYPASQPINFVDGSEPPMLLLYGDADATVGRHNLVNLAAEVKARQGQVDTRIYPGLDHGLIVAALAAPLQGRYPVYKDVVNFINSAAATGPTMTTTAYE